MSERMHDLPDFTLGRGDVKLPDLHDESWEPNIPQFLNFLRALNEDRTQPLGVVDGAELLVPPAADKPLVSIRYSYRERPASGIRAELDSQRADNRHAVTVGTGRHEILQAEGIMWKPWLTYEYRQQSAGPTTPYPHHDITWDGKGVALHDVKHRTPLKPHEDPDTHWERCEQLYLEQSRLILEKTVRLLS